MKNISDLLLGLIVFFIVPSPGLQASEPTLEWPDKTIQIGVRKFLPCSIYLPDDYQTSCEYPLVIGLHGFGSSPDRFAAILDYLDRQDFILAVPEPPYPYIYEGTRVGDRFSWDYQGDKSLWGKADPLVCRYIADVADSLRARFRISRTVILGFSQGAAYAYSAGIKYVDDVFGIAAFAGLFPRPEKYPWLMDDESLKRGSSIKVFISHGSHDRAISRKLSQEASDLLKASGYDVNLLIFAGGHTIPPEAFKTGLEWFGIDTE